MGITAFNPTPVRRILVIMLRHPGDVLLTSPVFSSLKLAMPLADIDALVYQDTHPMLSGHPDVNAIHTIDKKWKKLPWKERFNAEKGLMTLLKKQHYDLVIHLCNHWRGFWITLWLQPKESVAVERKEWIWGWIFKRCYKDDLPTKHRIERNLAAVEALGIASRALPLIFTPSKEAYQAFSQLLDTYHVTLGSYILIHPTARWLFKCWPATYVAELIGRLHEAGYKIILTGKGTPEELNYLESIRQACQGKYVDLVGQLTLDMLGACIASARLFIGVDSAPMHMASALNTPIMAFFGPTDETEWGPWRVPHILLSDTTLSCRPCKQDGCNGSKISQCLGSIEVSRAYECARQLLMANSLPLS